jgi:hypothetical protein
LRCRSLLAHSLGRLKEAIAFHEQAMALDPLLASSHSYLAFRARDSNAALAQLIKGHQYSMPYQIAEICAYRGQSDKAFDWLNRAYEHPGLQSLKSIPCWRAFARIPLFRPSKKDASTQLVTRPLNRVKGMVCC